jgi:hypothetical protein
MKNAILFKKASAVISDLLTQASKLESFGKFKLAKEDRQKAARIAKRLTKLESEV